MALLDTESLLASLETSFADVTASLQSLLSQTSGQQLPMERLIVMMS
jgi:hypothetical protein